MSAAPDAAPGASRFFALAELTFGGGWQSEVAGALGVSDRTVRRWIAGAGAPGARDWLLLCRYAQHRRAALLAAIEGRPVPPLSRFILAAPAAV